MIDQYSFTGSDTVINDTRMLLPLKRNNYTIKVMKLRSNVEYENYIIISNRYLLFYLTCSSSFSAAIIMKSLVLILPTSTLMDHLMYSVCLYQDQLLMVVM